MHVGAELTVQEVRALLSGQFFRRQGLMESQRDSIRAAEDNHIKGVSVDDLIPNNFAGSITFNVTLEPVTRNEVMDALTAADGLLTAAYAGEVPKNIYFSELLTSRGNGKFVYRGKVVGY